LLCFSHFTTSYFLQFYYTLSTEVVRFITYVHTSKESTHILSVTTNFMCAS